MSSEEAHLKEHTSMSESSTPLPHRTDMHSSLLSRSFAVLTRKKGIFVTLPRKDVQKGTAAYMKESNGSTRSSLVNAVVSRETYGCVYETTGVHVRHTSSFG